MSDFDENPFADPSVQNATQAARQTQNASLEDYDPFGGGGGSGGISVNGVTPSMTNTASPAVMQPVNVEAPPPAYQPTPAQRIDTDDLRRRQEELDRKAAELQQREQELLRQQNMAASGGVIRVNNWPPLPSWFPIQPCFYQDFHVEIPIEFQRIVKMTYYLWMFHLGVLLMNVIGGLAFFIADSKGGTVFGLGILYLLLFTPCSFICWYRPLYKAFRSDSSFNFMLFFFVFAVQCVASVVQCVGFTYFGTCGFINSVEQFSEKNIGAGIVMILVAIGFGVAATADIFLIIRVHRIYRSSGASITKAKEEFTTGVMSNKNVQSFAADAATAAARNAMSNSADPPSAGTSGNRF